MFNSNKENNTSPKIIVYQYLIDFIVIVFGISASFWVEEYRESLQHKEAEIKVLESLVSELNEIEIYAERRTKHFLEDREIVMALLNDTPEEDLNLESLIDSIFQIQIAVYDYRGFQPPMVRYQSILNEGSFKYVSSDDIKTMFNELNTKYLSVISGNVQQEKDIQHQIILHLTKHHPQLLIRFDGNKTSDSEYMMLLEDILEEDQQLKALIKIKSRFITVKMYFVHEYLTVAKNLRELIQVELKKR